MRRQGNGSPRPRRRSAPACSTERASSRQTVKARHQERVAFAEGGNRAPKLGAVALRAAGCLLENLFGSGGAQGLHLRVNALAVGETRA